MTNPYQVYYDFLIEHVLTPFYDTRLIGLQAMRLDNVLRSKNPYLFRAKNMEFAGDFVKSIVDAFLSSQEETIFGNLLEKFAIYVSSVVDDGFKSGFKSVDLEFQRAGIYYIVGIKSGTNWGNADQVNTMKNNFKAARESLRQQAVLADIVAVNGCMYGTETHPLRNKKDRGRTDEDPDKIYYKYAGQDFWYFVSKDDALYQEIIVPIDQEARKKDEAFKIVYSSKINEMTKAFIDGFMLNNQIDWTKLIDFVSKRKGTAPPQLSS